MPPEVRFEHLFREHYSAVWLYVTRVWSSVEVDDVVAQVFEIAWRRLDEIPGHAARGWLIATARNCALNELRATRRRADRLSAMRSTDTRADVDLFDRHVPEETVAALRNALDQLRPADQEVLLLAAWSGLSGDDLGAALGCSASAAAVRLFRARSRLRAALADAELSA